MKRWLIMIGVVLAMVAVIGGIWWYNVSQKLAAYKAMGTPKQSVTAMKAESQEWRQQVTAVGSLHAVRGADLSTEVAGVVESIHFESGADVKAGTLLVQLRADDDIGRLESLKANAELAQLNYERAVKQLDAQAISKAELDTQKATARSAKAQVAEQQAIVDKKRIRAPFNGHIGIRNADPGQYAADARSYPCRLLPPAAATRRPARRANRQCGERYLPEPEVRGSHHRDRPEGRHRYAQRAGTRHAAEPETAAAARHVREYAGRSRQAAELHHAAEHRADL
jgi:multidrug efflux pump subunit AcrA (membrane-fusion protein)